jgi:hypothetical protein
MWLAASPAAGAAQGDTPTEVVSASLSRASIAVRGLATVPLTVAVRLRDPEGVTKQSPNPYSNAWVPAVSLTPISGQACCWIHVSLELMTGSPTDGTWSGAVNVPAAADGQWRFDSVTLVDPDAAVTEGYATYEAPVPNGSRAMVTVTGTHRPVLTAGPAPALVGYGAPYAVKGRVRDAETGAGFAGGRIHLGTANICGEGPGYGATVGRANDAGYFTIAIDRAESPYVHCADLLGPENSDGFRQRLAPRRNAGPTIYARVGVRLTRAQAPLHTPVDVTGSVLPDDVSPCRVHLQRRDDDGWHTVAAASVRTSGRYSLTAQPTTRGRFAYRVLFVGYPHDDCPTGGTPFHSGSSSIRYLTAT